MNFNLTLQQAFEFLELPESATREQIAIRLVEKKEYFEELVETAPTDFLKRINKKNIDKLSAVQQLHFDWSIQRSEVEVIFPKDDYIVPVDHDPMLTTPIILRSRQRSKQQGPDLSKAVGWLIKHTERKAQVIFELFIGKNFIGRKSQPDYSPFLTVDDDRYVSRLHAILWVEFAGIELEYYILDSPALGYGNMSTNGTFINGNDHRIAGKVRITNNDTIQIGVTKFVFRTNEVSLEQNLKEIQQMAYMKTIAVS